MLKNSPGLAPELHRRKNLTKQSNSSFSLTPECKLKCDPLHQALATRSFQVWLKISRSMTQAKPYITLPPLFIFIKALREVTKTYATKLCQCLFVCLFLKLGVKNLCWHYKINKVSYKVNKCLFREYCGGH